MGRSIEVQCSVNEGGTGRNNLIFTAVTGDDSAHNVEVWKGASNNAQGRIEMRDVAPGFAKGFEVGKRYELTFGEAVDDEHPGKGHGVGGTPPAHGEGGSGGQGSEHAQPRPKPHEEEARAGRSR